MKNILPNNSLIVDSGFWIALGSPKDKYFRLAQEALLNYKQFVFISTWPVIIETSYLLHKRMSFKAQQVFLTNIEQGGMEVFHLNIQGHLNKCRKLMHKYQDLPMDLADASLVILAEELGHGRVLSTDQRDFNTYRWKNHKPFENLLLGMEQ